MTTLDIFTANGATVYVKNSNISTARVEVSRGSVCAELKAKETDEVQFPLYFLLLNKRKKNLAYFIAKNLITIFTDHRSPGTSWLFWSRGKGVCGNSSN